MRPAFEDGVIKPGGEESSDEEGQIKQNKRAYYSHGDLACPRWMGMGKLGEKARTQDGHNDQRPQKHERYRDDQVVENMGRNPDPKSGIHKIWRRFHRGRKGIAGLMRGLGGRHRRRERR